MTKDSHPEPDNLVGFHQPGAKERIQKASEAGLSAMVDQLPDKNGNLNEYEIEGAFCAMIQAHFGYMAEQEGPDKARDMADQFLGQLRDTLQALDKK